MKYPCVGLVERYGSIGPYVSGSLALGIFPLVPSLYFSDFFVLVLSLDRELYIFR